MKNTDVIEEEHKVVRGLSSRQIENVSKGY